VSNAAETHSRDHLVELAESLCEARGLRLTAWRRRILEVLCENDRPMSAYEMLDQIVRRGGPAVAAPTIYRSLEFLMTQGLVSRIESRNAFVACAEPERPHACVFFLCGECGDAHEREDVSLEQRLAKDAASLGFEMTRRVVEVEGTCRRCQNSPPN